MYCFQKENMLYPQYQNRKIINSTKTIHILLENTITNDFERNLANLNIKIITNNTKAKHDLINAKEKINFTSEAGHYQIEFKQFSKNIWAKHPKIYKSEYMNIKSDFKLKNTHNVLVSPKPL